MGLNRSSILSRKCISCGLKKHKSELFRIAKMADSHISLDVNDKLEGRGAYVCLNIECIDKVIRRRLIDKALRQRISKELYENLKSEFLKLYE